MCKTRYSPRNHILLLSDATTITRSHFSDKAAENTSTYSNSWISQEKKIVKMKEQRDQNREKGEKRVVKLTNCKVDRWMYSSGGHEFLLQ